MPAAERSVLHVLPHPGGGGETYVDVLTAMPGYRFDRDLPRAKPDAVAVRSSYAALVEVMRSARTIRPPARPRRGRGRAVPPAPRHSSVGRHAARPPPRTAPERSPPNGRSAQPARRLRAADRTICVSEAEHEELIRAVGSACGAPGGRHPQRRPRFRLRRARPSEPRCAGSSVVAESELVGIWIGSLDERKDPLAAVRAAERASVALLVVGDGPLRHQVERSRQRARPCPRSAERRPSPSRGGRLLRPHVTPRGARPLPPRGDGARARPGRDRAARERRGGRRRGHRRPGRATTKPWRRRSGGSPRTTARALRSAQRARQRVVELFGADEMIARTRAVYDEVLAGRRST